MQEERPHYEAVMKIAEGNHDAAIFLCGILSLTASEHFLCRLLEAYNVLEQTAGNVGYAARGEARKSRYNPE